MSYTKQGFQSGDRLYASQLNAMDDQIAENESRLDHLEENATINYNNLSNKPTLNGVTISGNQTSADFGIPSAEGIPAMVDDWLEENITNPDSPPLDRSLSSSSAAAPADLVGEELANLKQDLSEDEYVIQNEILETGTSLYFAREIGSASGDIGEAISYSSSSSWVHAIIDVEPGEIYVVSVVSRGQDTHYHIKFINDNSVVLYASMKTDAAQGVSVTKIIVVPDITGISKMVVDGYSGNKINGIYRIPSISGYVDEKEIFTNEFINDKHNLINYDYDIPANYYADPTPTKTASKIGIKRYLNTIVLNGSSYDESPTKIRLNGRVVRTVNNNEVAEWEGCANFIAGHKYKLRSIVVGGSIKDDNNDPVSCQEISIYQSGESSTIGEYIINGNEFQRIFVAEENTNYNIVAYVYPGYTYTNAKVIVTIEDITSTPIEVEDVTELTDNLFYFTNRVDGVYNGVTVKYIDPSTIYVQGTASKATYLPTSVRTLIGEYTFKRTSWNYSGSNAPHLQIDGSTSDNGTYTLTASNVVRLALKKDNSFDGYYRWSVTAGDEAAEYNPGGPTAIDYVARKQINEIKIDVAPEIPDYYVDHIAEKAHTINEILGGGTLDAYTPSEVEQFIWFTDYHYDPNEYNASASHGDSNTKHSPALMYYLLNHTGANKIIFGGDVATSYSNSRGQQYLLDCLADFKETFSFAKYNLFSVNGNHEYNTTSVPSYGKLSQFMRGGIDFKVDEFDSFGDYIVEVKSKKLWYIMINSKNNTWSDGNQIADDQIKYLFSKLEEIPDGYSAIIVTHSMLLYTGTMNDWNWSLTTAGTKISNGITAFVNRQSHTFDNETYDFSSVNADIVCILSGHTHVDTDYTLPSQVPVIMTTSDTARKRGASYYDSEEETWVDSKGFIGTYREQAFDVVTLDKKAHKIYMTRIGYEGFDPENDFVLKENGDREFTYPSTIV